MMVVVLQEAVRKAEAHQRVPSLGGESPADWLIGRLIASHDSPRNNS